MVRIHWVRLLFCLKLTFTPCRSLTGEGICIDSNGQRCCTDYIQMGDTCVQCEPGYHGTNCSLTCPEHYYGRLCREHCNCDSDKYCDSSVGCLCKNNSVNCTDQRWVCISLYSYSV
ncbi:multiple epidermal growth factor-like domains protein 10 isoform X1 [Crassostrea virginica]